MPTTTSIARISCLLALALGAGLTPQASAAGGKKKPKPQPTTSVPASTPVNKPAAKPTNAPPVDPGTTPKPQPKATPKATQIPVNLEPVSDAAVHPLDASIIDGVKEPKLLSKVDVAAAAGRFAIDVQPNEVQKAISLTVRRPFLGQAYLSFPYAAAVRPEVFPDGVAVLDKHPAGSVRRVRDSGPPLNLQSPDQAERERQVDPFNPGFPEDAEVSVDGAHLAISFRAAANRDYLISCRVNPHFAERWGALVHTDAQFFDYANAAVGS